MKRILFSAIVGVVATSIAHAEECRVFPQQLVINNRLFHAEAVACRDDKDRWRVVSFKDTAGNDLPAPSEILYPQPKIIMTSPQTAFTPAQPINAMPMPYVTFYEQRY